MPTAAIYEVVCYEIYQAIGIQLRQITVWRAASHNYVVYGQRAVSPAKSIEQRQLRVYELTIGIHMSYWLALQKGISSIP